MPCPSSWRIAASSLLASLPLATTELPAQGERPVHRMLAWFDGEVERFVTAMRRAHEQLLPRAASDSESAARLSPAPPAPRPRGHGLLPSLRPDLSHRSAPLHCRRYSLAELSTTCAPDLRDIALLAAAAGDASLPLAAQVAEFVRLRQRLDLLQTQVAYHRHWQSAVVEHAAWFEGRNRIAARVANLQRLRADPAQAAAAAALADEIVREVAPFVPSPGLRLVAVDDVLRLSVPIATDIADAPFLERFRAAIATEWTNSPAARRHQLTVEVDVRVLSAGELGAAPPPGQVAAAATLLARFPEGTMVLTTGVASTHAILGRGILLGTDPVRPRELAHEFGHLLGFQDAYLRAFEGSPQDPYGVVLVEWDGLLDDLMGASREGQVDDRMIERLIAAYR